MNFAGVLLAQREASNIDPPSPSLSQTDAEQQRIRFLDLWWNEHERV